METHARFLLIGVFSLAVTLGLILFVLWLGKLQLDRDFQEYEVRFEESVAGLSVGGIVQYQGVQVGEVRKLALDPKDPRKVAARIRVAAETPIKTDTRAQLTYTGLTGVAAIELLGGTPDAPLLREVDTSALPRIETIPSSLSQLMSGGSGAVRSAEDALSRINRVLTDENLERVSNLLGNLESISASARDDYPALRDALGELRDVGQRLDAAVRRTDALLSQLQSGLGKASDSGEDAYAEARAALVEIRAAAQSVRELAGSGERMVADFDRRSGAELFAALQALRVAVERIDRIAAGIEQSPADYLLRGDPLPLYTPDGADR